jgi:hypothetical protein
MLQRNNMYRSQLEQREQEIRDRQQYYTELNKIREEKARYEYEIQMAELGNKRFEAIIGNPEEIRKEMEDVRTATEINALDRIAGLPEFAGVGDFESIERLDSEIGSLNRSLGAAQRSDSMTDVFALSASIARGTDPIEARKQIAEAAASGVNEANQAQQDRLKVLMPYRERVVSAFRKDWKIEKTRLDGQLRRATAAANALRGQSGGEVPSTSQPSKRPIDWDGAKEESLDYVGQWPASVYDLDAQDKGHKQLIKELTTGSQPALAHLDHMVASPDKKKQTEKSTQVWTFISNNREALNLTNDDVEAFKLIIKNRYMVE